MAVCRFLQKRRQGSLENLPISNKLITGFGTVIVLMILCIGVSIFNAKTLLTQLDLYDDDTLPMVHQAGFGFHIG